MTARGRPHRLELAALVKDGAAYVRDRAGGSGGGRGGGGGGGGRVRSHCRFAVLLSRFIPCSLTYSVARFLK
jgi:hypothetical protein